MRTLRDGYACPEIVEAVCAFTIATHDNATINTTERCMQRMLHLPSIRRYSGRAPEALIILPIFSISLRTKPANSSGVAPPASIP